MNRLIMFFTLAIVLGASCQRKELLDPHDHYNLIIKGYFDSTANSQLISQMSTYAPLGEPASTNYILYERNSQKVAYRGSFDGLTGGLYVEEGYYDLLLYTTDFNEVDANFFRGLDNPLTAETYTRQNPKDDSLTTDVVEMYMVEPDPTFGVLREQIVVFSHEEDQLIEVELVQKSFKYFLTIRATGLHNIHTATMNISGMYTTAFLATEEHRMDEAGTQTVEMQIRRSEDPDDEVGTGTLYGEFWSFGPNQREDILNSITLYFVNGDVIVKQLKDLTGQIKALPRGGEIIVEEELEIKGPGGGFNPGVGDWDDSVDVDLRL